MENIKAKIQGILMNSSQKSVIGWAVEEDDFEAVAEEIVKKCFIHSVSNSVVCSHENYSYTLNNDVKICDDCDAIFK